MSAYNDLRVNEKPAFISNYSGERFNAEQFGIDLLKIFKTDDNLSYNLIFKSGSGNANVRNDSLFVTGNTVLNVEAIDGINQKAISGDLAFEQYVSLKINLVELFSDSAVSNATIKLWDGISKVYDVKNKVGNNFEFELDNKNQYYQVMITSPDFTERNDFIFMDKYSIDTVMNVISNKFNWEAYKSMYQYAGNDFRFPIDGRYPEGIKPIIYMVNSREQIKDNTNPDVEGSLKYIEKHFTEKKTFENFTYNKIGEVKDLEIIWIDSMSQLPDFRAPDQYFIALLMDNKMSAEGSVTPIVKELTLGTALCRFQTHTNFSNYDHTVKEEIGTALVGALSPTYYDATGQESIFQRWGPPNFTQLDSLCSRVYSERHKMDGDNALPPFEGKLSDPKNMKFIFQAYQEKENIQNNIYTRFKNFVAEIQRKLN
jgi:hypothetical protein